MILENVFAKIHTMMQVMDNLYAKNVIILALIVLMGKQYIIKIFYKLPYYKYNYIKIININVS